MCKIFIFLFCTSIFSVSNAQVDKPIKDSESSTDFRNSLGEMKISLNEKGDKYLKFGVSSQIWLRSIENNPGTAVNGVAQDQTTDAGLRRARLSTQFQLSRGYLVFFQLGINNQSFISGGGTGTGANGQGKKPGIFFMDAYNEFAVIPKNNFDTNAPNKYNLYIGAGLHAWNGVSRLSNASTTKLLTVDIPVFNFPNIEMSDQFSRQFGVFAHGDLDRINYRVAVNKPFATNRVPAVGGPSVENNGSGNLAYSAYAMYQFLDKESTTTSFLPGTYLGSKSIFSIGAGFYSTKDALMSQPVKDQFEKYDQLNLGGDVFWEIPVGSKIKEMSLSFYSAYYYNDFGKNYLRTSGIMNPGTRDENYLGQIAAEGFGNSKYLNGTGNIWYTQAGFALPKFSRSILVQPFAAYHRKNLKALNDIGHFYDIGTNIFLYSQNAKISIQYSSRPLYNVESHSVFDRKGEFILAILVAL